MMDICINGARVAVHRWNLFLHSPVGVYLSSLLTGAVGIAILLLFFAMILSADVVTLLLPLIVGFNSASSGFALIDRSTGSGRKRFPLLTIALLLTAIGLTGNTLLFPWIDSVQPFLWIIVLTFAIVAAFTGAWLAEKRAAGVPIDTGNPRRQEVDNQ